MECTEPDYRSASSYFLVSAVLLAVPVLVGVASSRRFRSIWLWAAAALIFGLVFPFTGLP